MIAENDRTYLRARSSSD